MVKPHGFVLDFVGIFDKLEKALAFDSDEVNAIVKNIKLLKLLFKNKMEQDAPNTFPSLNVNSTTRMSIPSLNTSATLSGGKGSSRSITVS